MSHELDEPNEPMTGWDELDTVERTLGLEAQGTGKKLIIALARYLELHAPDDVRHPELNLARKDVQDAMHDIDWNAMDFSQNAIDRGEEIFSSVPGHDVLIKYTPRGHRDPDQPEFAF